MERVVIHSVPRSGSTWLGAIFDSHPNTIYKLQPLFSYAFKSRLTPLSTKEEIDSFFFELEHSKNDFMDQKEGKKRGIIPSFEKQLPVVLVYKEVRYHHILQNLLEKDSTVKIIGLIRNPLSVIFSWLKAPKEFRGNLGWKIEDEWRYAPQKNMDKPEEFNGYEKWKEVTYLFESLKATYPERFYLLNYDTLLHETIETTKDLFAFCNLKMQQQTNEFINTSTSTTHTDAYSVFKSKKSDDNWKGNLPKFIVDEVTADTDFIHLNKKYNWL